jgi:hypothetical protein
MLTRTITGALLALISFAFVPGGDDQPKLSTSQQISEVQLDLAETIEQLSSDAKLAELARSLDGVQQRQSDIVAILDDLAAQLKRNSTVKYITRNDLDDAIATTKETVEKAKEFSAGCDCDCLAKIADLEQRLAALEAKCAEKVTSQYSTKSGGSTGSVAMNQAYSTQTSNVQTVQTVTSSGGCTGKTTTSSYPATMVELPERTRTVKVVEPFARRQVTFAEVPENADLSLAVQSNSQCYTDESGNRVCPQSVQPVQASAPQSKPKLGSRLRSIFGR